MRKTAWIALIVIVALVAMAGCTPKPPEEITVKVVVPDGITALGMAKMLKEKPEIASYVTVEYEIARTTDVLSSKIINQEADIAVVPSTLAAVAYNRDLPYRLAGTMGWGSFYILTTQNISTWADLKGKTIANTGRGQTPDIVLQYLLEANGVDPETDLELTYVNAATELAPAFIAGSINLAMMPEPMLTTVMGRVQTAKIILDVNEEWKKVTDSELGYPQSSLIIKKDLLDNHKAFADEFMTLFAAAIEWAKTNPVELASYASELEIAVPAPAIAQAMSRANQGFLKAKDTKAEYNAFFDALFGFDPAVLGGKLPDEGIFAQ
jgi:NitT/TauT family transport system substrate-binding protein